MKKEKWLVKEIDKWEEQAIISTEQAATLKRLYQPKKSISILMILFSVVGSLLIGMGIVLVSANNWWYSMPIAARAFIGFLPLLISQALVVFVYKNKMESMAFRESAALLNMAGVFASIAIVGQIFHLPGDFTAYLFTCGILSLPSMLIMNAISPLAIFYWTAINGGLCVGDDFGIIAAFLLFGIGCAYALGKCREKGSRSVYLSVITAVAGFFLVFSSALMFDCDMSIALYSYCLLLLCTAPLLKGCEAVFSVGGGLCMLVLSIVLTYSFMWEWRSEFDSVIFLGVTIAATVAATAFYIKNATHLKPGTLSTAALLAIVLRGVWSIFGLAGSTAAIVFSVIFNLLVLCVGILSMLEGVRKIDLYNANIGMVTVCTLIIVRFFDSELPLFARGIAFMVLGGLFLLFNLYIVKIKKKTKEDAA